MTESKHGSGQPFDWHRMATEDGSTHGVFYVVEFEDGTCEGQILGHGDEKTCESARNCMPGVAYSGPKRTLGAYTSVRPWPEVAKIFGLVQ